MSKSLIYLIGIFALWFYFYLADKNEDSRKGFDMKEADEAQSGRGGTATVNWRGGGFVNPSFTELPKGGRM